MNPKPTVDHKKMSIILAFVLPIVLIVGVLISSNMSFLKAETEYDFVYAICNIENGRYNYYNHCQNYLLDIIQIDEDGTFYRGEVNPNRDSNQDGVLDKDESYKIRYFYHDVDTNISREINESDVVQYRFSPLLNSPDGATVEYEYQGSPGVLFFDIGSGGYEYHLVQGNRTKTLNIIDGTDNRYYGNENFTFVGWILN